MVSITTWKFPQKFRSFGGFVGYYIVGFCALSPVFVRLKLVIFIRKHISGITNKQLRFLS